MKNLNKDFNFELKYDFNGISKLNIVTVPAGNAANSGTYVKNVSFRKIVKIKDRYKYFKKFSNSIGSNLKYSCNEFKKSNFYYIDTDYANDVGFVEYGFIRDKVTLTSIYIKQKYRNNGIYEYILKNTVSGITIQSVVVVPNEYYKHRDFFTRCGFPYVSKYNLFFVDKL